jgi:hypothetical protein
MATDAVPKIATAQNNELTVFIFIGSLSFFDLVSNRFGRRICMPAGKPWAGSPSGNALSHPTPYRFDTLP